MALNLPAPVRFAPLGVYVGASNGVFLEWETPIHRSRIPISDDRLWQPTQGSIPFVENTALTPLFELKTEKIPLAIIMATIKFYRHMMTLGDTTVRLSRNQLLSGLSAIPEVPRMPLGSLRQMEGELWWCRVDGDWSLTQPEQFAAAGSVATPAIHVDNQVGMVTHSHGRLSAYFSKHADDVSEVDGFIYLVFGRLHQSVPEVAARVGVNGYWMEVDIDDILDYQ